MQRNWAWLVLLGVAACGGGTTENNNGNNNGNNDYPGDPGGAPVQAATVEVEDNRFSPDAVVVTVGGTVTFHWVGGAGHSVTPSGTPTFSPTAGVSYPPKDLTVTFTAPGVYEYYCTIHGGSDGYGGRGNMLGTVIVR